MGPMETNNGKRWCGPEHGDWDLGERDRTGRKGIATVTGGSPPTRMYPKLIVMLRRTRVHVRLHVYVRERNRIRRRAYVYA